MSFVFPKTFSHVPTVLLTEGFSCRANSDSHGSGEQQPPGAAGEWSKVLHFAVSTTKWLEKALLLCTATSPLCLKANFCDKFETGFNQLSLTVHQFSTSGLIFPGQ